MSTTLDHGYTCSDIDGAITEIKAEMASTLDDVISDYAPQTRDEDREDAANGFADDLYGEIESHIEAVRKTNEDLRSAAERQLEEMQDRIDELESEVNDLECDKDRLEDEIHELESESA